MFVADSIIKKEGKSLITPFENERVGPISYDLSAKEFHTTKDGEIVTQSEISLLPGESVFVSCEETITLPGDMAAVINARNSRIRQGLRIDAPIYYPGHKTRVFFRVSNVSKECIVFSKKEKYAAIYFVKVDGIVEKPYKGEFENELHSILGTEFAGLSEELEQHYRQIFKNRQAIVAMNQASQRPFWQKQQLLDNLKNEITNDEASLKQRQAEYEQAVRAFNAEVVKFNQRASKAGGFQTQAEFQARRAELASRQAQLRQRQSQLTTAITQLNQKIDRYNQTNLAMHELNRSLDSLDSPHAPDTGVN